MQMFEQLESRRLLSAAGGIGDAVEAHADAVIAVRADLASRREAIRNVLGEHRETLRSLIESRRDAMKQLISSIRDAKGDADARAALKAQLADLRSQFKADLAAARSDLKEALDRARAGLKDATAGFRDAAADLVADVHALHSTTAPTADQRPQGLRDLVAELKAIGRDRGDVPTADRVREIVEQIRDITGPDSGDEPLVILAARPHVPVGPPTDLPTKPETPVGPPETPPALPPGPPVIAPSPF